MLVRASWYVRLILTVTDKGEKFDLGSFNPFSIFRNLNFKMKIDLAEVVKTKFPILLTPNSVYN